ncbi:MAG: glycosyltransferase [Chloroflexi bacterium]|nr:glycosyltransferase [Chloroflexota bacterium]
MSIACLDQAELIEQALEWSCSPSLHTIYYANANCLNLAYQDESYCQLLISADLVYADGIGPVWAGRLFGGCRLHKLTGADWMGPLCERLAAAGANLYLLGGRPGVAQKAAQNLLERYPSLKIVGTADGFFGKKSGGQVAAEIAKLRPQIVLVGMGVPQQECWISSHQEALPAGLWWGVGALFDFLAGVERRVPSWMNRMGLEWLWRFGQDPAGKWRRYLLGNPLFAARIFRQLINLDSKR